MANRPVARDHEYEKNENPDKTNVEIKHEITVVSLVHLTSQFPYVVQSRAQPEAFIASTNDRVGVRAENGLPNVASSGERGIATDSTSHLAVDVKAERQNQIDAKSGGNHELQKARTALENIGVGSQENQTAHDQAKG